RLNTRPRPDDRAAARRTVRARLRARRRVAAGRDHRGNGCTTGSALSRCGKIYHTISGPRAAFVGGASFASENVEGGILEPSPCAAMEETRAQDGLKRTPRASVTHEP